MCDDIFTAVVLDDTSTYMAYDGAGWASVTGSSSLFNGTAHTSTAAGDRVSLSFSGPCISIYGSVEDWSAVSYEVDEASPVVVVPQDSAGVGSPLYTSPRLADGSHTLTVRALKPQTAMSLDYVRYGSAKTPSASSIALSLGHPVNAVDSPNPSPTSDISSLKPFVVSGAVTSAIACLILLVYVSYLLVRKFGKPPVSPLRAIEESVAIPMQRLPKKDKKPQGGGQVFEIEPYPPSIVPEFQMSSPKSTKSTKAKSKSSHTASSGRTHASSASRPPRAGPSSLTISIPTEETVDASSDGESMIAQLSAGTIAQERAMEKLERAIEEQNRRRRRHDSYM